ncbi:MAG: hypothetical protein U0L27_07415 [Ruminococcus sp.]|nr:hypothetical protein [Ruminococcus sp.]
MQCTVFSPTSYTNLYSTHAATNELKRFASRNVLWAAAKAAKEI